MKKLSMARLAGGLAAILLLGAQATPNRATSDRAAPKLPAAGAGAGTGARPTLPGEIWVVLENPNSARDQDLFELYDKVCNVELPAIALRGHGSESFAICGGLGQPGAIRIRYSGEPAWTDVEALHGWSVIEAPRRPMGHALEPAPTDDGDDE